MLYHHRDSLSSVIFTEHHVKYKMKVVVSDIMPELPFLHNYVLSNCYLAFETKNAILC